MLVLFLYCTYTPYLYRLVSSSTHHAPYVAGLAVVGDVGDGGRRARVQESRRRIISLCQMISADFSRFPRCAHLSGLPLLLSCSLPLRSSSFNKDDASSHAGGQCCQILRNCAKMAHLAAILAPHLAHFESAFAHCAKSQKFGAF